MGRRESGLQHIVQRGVLFGLGTTIIVMNFALAFAQEFVKLILDCRLTVDSQVSFIGFFPSWMDSTQDPYLRGVWFTC